MTQLPEKDELSWSKKQLLARMDVAMGGRVAEEIIFGLDNITTGASSDLEHATRIATNMVTKFGMTDSVSTLILSCVRIFILLHFFEQSEVPTWEVCQDHVLYILTPLPSPPNRLAWCLTMTKQVQLLRN